MSTASPRAGGPYPQSFELHETRSVTPPPGPYLQSFKLYETRSNFYLIGSDVNMTIWSVMKIDRSELWELNVWEDPVMYSESECSDLLIRLHEGNRLTGGLKFITNCYGIIGFVKFLGPYYMMLITQRRKIGEICGHAVYAISKSEMLAITDLSVRSDMSYAEDEKRYKKLLCTMDLTKDFFFSYSYPIMHSLQKNFCSSERGQILYETMFVWNEFLTRQIRNDLKNAIWTVALVYGSFEQTNFSISGKDMKLTLIARRSRHFAGTRYLKRGVNEKGRVANDVETEQIVFDDTSMQISSIVQNRGSIPLFWSQEASWINIRPDIILQNEDKHFHATRLHFDDLRKRYGNPTIILNLIKAREKKPRESILLAEFRKAIDFLNRSLPNMTPLEYLHCDLHKHFPRKARDSIALLGKLASNALESTGFFYYQLASTAGPGSLLWPPLMNSGMSESESPKEANGIDTDDLARLPMLQKGVLRTNCIDCLDRTNLAQFVFGLAALGRQLHACGVIKVPVIDLDDPLDNDLMRLYEKMGDTLAQQYGGSSSHKKVFSERRGQWKAATQSQDLFTTIQRYYNNTYMDAKKQDAINVFLGHFQPKQGKPVLWELDSDQYYNVGGSIHTDENERSSLKRSLSDGNILCESSTLVSCSNPAHGNVLSESSTLVSCSNPAQNETSTLPSYERTRCLRVTTDMYSPLTEMASADSTSIARQLRKNFQRHSCSGYGFDTSTYSKNSDLDCLFSSQNSFEEGAYNRSSIKLPVKNLNSEEVGNGTTTDSTPAMSQKVVIESGCSFGAAQNAKISTDFSNDFVRWVAHGSSISN